MNKDRVRIALESQQSDYKQKLEFIREYLLFKKKDPNAINRFLIIISSGFLEWIDEVYDYILEKAKREFEITILTDIKTNKLIMVL